MSVFFETKGEEKRREEIVALMVIPRFWKVPFWVVLLEMLFRYGQLLIRHLIPISWLW
jgi:hypothetical protein